MVTGAVYRLVRGEKTTMVDSLGVAVSRSRVMHDIGSETRAEGFSESVSEPFGVSGCAPFYRRDMLDDVAVDGEVFRESFGSYYEDVDLAWRARLRGWAAVCWSRARAWHVREGSLKGPYRRVARRRAFRNRLWTLFLNERPSIWLSHLPYWLPHELFQLAKICVQPDLLLAGAEAVLALPRLRRQRRRNRSSVRITPAQERALFSRGDGSLLRRVRRRLREEVHA
jgi:GT2 family glycosyltransferase